MGIKGGTVPEMLAEYGRKIARQHLVMGAMGNISAREGKIVWIKRGGAWLERAKPEDFIAVDAQSGKGKSGRSPSKEVFLHLGCYRARPDIGAVVHTHPLMATALATAGINLRTSLTLKYFPPGSKKLAEAVRRKIKKTKAVTLANHGLVTVGKDIKQAYARTCACEKEAKRRLRWKFKRLD